MRGTIALATATVLTSVAAFGGAPPSDDPARPFTETIEGTVVSFEMVPLPTGTVTIDGEHVTTDPVWIGKTEVTWDAFDAFMFGLDGQGGSSGDGATGTDAIARPSKPYISMDRGFGHAGYPAISVSYHSAQTFCAWLSQKTGRRYRLPTEAEWLRACALSGIEGDGAEERAWHADNARYKTHPAGKKGADELGLHDLWGNAAEWCTGADGRPVTMGGSYRDGPEELGCGARVPPSDAWNASDPQIPKSIWWLADAGFIGFRLVCDPKPAAPPSTP